MNFKPDFAKPEGPLRKLGGYKPRKNIQVSDQMRMKLLDLIHNQKYSITKAAQMTGINYENAKLIN